MRLVDRWSVLGVTVISGAGGYKPSPAPIHHICERWNLHPTEILMVGDGSDDLASGRNAGSTTVLVLNDTNGHLEPQADHVIRTLDELKHLLLRLEQPQPSQDEAKAEATPKSK